MGSQPEGQHHLCEDGADYKHKIGVPHRFIASIIHEKMRKMMTCRDRKLQAVHLGCNGNCTRRQKTFDVVLGWKGLTFAKFGV